MRTLWHIGFTRPGKTADWYAWLFWTWDMPNGCPALNIVRERGFRVLGVEVSRIVATI